MDSRYRPQPIHGQAPDPVDYYWLALWPPDGVFVAPPDPAEQLVAESGGRAELLLLVGLLLAVGFLAAAIILSAAVR